MQLGQRVKCITFSFARKLYRFLCKIRIAVERKAQHIEPILGGGAACDLLVRRNTIDNKQYAVERELADCMLGKQ